jgi:molecular chaperone Hsp33
MRTHPVWKSPYTGSTALYTGEITEDIAVYLSQSEQIPSAIALGVSTSGDKVDSAAGYLCTALPGCSEEELSILESNIKALPLPCELVLQGNTADDLATMLTKGLGEQFRVRETPTLKCSCSRERFLRSLLLLGTEEVADIIAKDESNEVTCHWCSSAVTITAAELKQLVESDEGSSILDTGHYPDQVAQRAEKKSREPPLAGSALWY